MCTNGTCVRFCIESEIFGPYICNNRQPVLPKNNNTANILVSFEILQLLIFAQSDVSQNDKIVFEKELISQ